VSKYVIVPADIEPTVVCNLADGGHHDWNLLSPEASRLILPDVDGGKAKKELYNPRVEFLNALNPGDELYAPLGGIGDAFLVGAYQRGAVIHRIPFLELANLPRGEVRIPRGVAGKALSAEDETDILAVKAKKQHGERLEMTAKIAGLIETHADSFRDFRECDFRIAVIRTLITQLIAIQDEVRKRLQQRTTRLERDGAYILKPDSPTAAAHELRVQWVESGPSVDALLALEDDLTKKIERQLKCLPVFNEVLNPVRGMGPRLSARILAPIVDIRRFPRLAGFIRYAGWAPMLVKGDATGRRVAAKFVRGESAQFHELLRQGAWLFGGQIVRNASQFRGHYDTYKAANADKVGAVMYTNGKDRKLTKAWLEARARRYAVGKFLKYLWFGWWGLEGKTFHAKADGKPFTSSDLLQGAAALVAQ